MNATRQILFAFGLMAWSAIGATNAIAQTTADTADSTNVASAAVAEEESEPTTVPWNPTPQSTTDAKQPLTYLVPELEGNGYRVKPGPQPFANRLSFSPSIGELGSLDYFALRFAFNPNSWLGYEVSLGHNPAQSLHGVLHTVSMQLRYPIPWRVQPYVTVGYGMLTIYPGKALNADPVTKNAVTSGGGLEIYLRDDVALRGEMRGATIYGQQRGVDGTVSYAYLEYTVGFAFYRSVRR